MTRHEEKEATKVRILSACVKLFLEQGYYKTTLSQIAKEAKVSFSSFQNIFQTKDGVLLELTEIMFGSQFKAARGGESNDIKPVFEYATEVAIQLTLTELNENLREIYVEAYSNTDALEFIHQRMSAELRRLFKSYNKGFAESDFYELEIGTSGMMRNYMARKCDQYFTLDKKLKRFVEMSLRAYNVPQEEVDEAVEFVLDLDIKKISNEIMHSLFEMLAMKFNFSLEEIGVF